MSLTPSLIETLRTIDWPEIATASGDTLLMLGGSLLFTAAGWCPRPGCTRCCRWW